MKKPLERAYNRWQHLRETTIFQLSNLEREGIIPTEIAEPLRAAFYEADEVLKANTFSECERCRHE